MKEQILHYFKDKKKEFFKGSIDDIDDFLNLLKENGIYFKDDKFFYDGKTGMRFFSMQKIDFDEFRYALVHDEVKKDVFFRIIIHRNEEQQQEARKLIYESIVDKPIFEISLNDLDFLEKHYNSKYLEVRKIFFK